MRRILLPLVALALLLAACGDDSDDVETGGGDAGADLAEIAGHTFLGEERTQDGELDPLVDGSTVSLSFEAAQLSANAGCNTMGGGYSLDGDVLVLDGELAMTQMACDEALMDQDTWLAEFLGSRPALAFDGTALTVTSGGTELVLSDSEVADPDRPVTGTVWKVDSVYSGGGPDGAVSSVPSDLEATLTIADDGTYAISTGCNSGSGGVEVGEGTLTFEPPMLTRVACKDEWAPVEAAMLALFDGEVTYEVSGGSMTVLAQDGSGLGFVAS